jgi:hypothetical protein
LPQNLSNDEKAKHQHFIQKYINKEDISGILDHLTPDDLRMLIETEDEYARRGNFARVFPTTDSKRYLKFFETTRYYNILLNEWLTRYGQNNRERGIFFSNKFIPKILSCLSFNLNKKGLSILNNFCLKNVHKQNPTSRSENQVNLKSKQPFLFI